MKDGIERLDPRDLSAVADVARLHAGLLSESPIVGLGPAFMRRFYYRKLVEDGLVAVSIYYCKGVAAGFIAYTGHSSTFMAEGLRRHWFCLSLVLAGSVLRDPRRFRGIIWTLNHMRKQRSAPRESPPGELLSFGVLSEYRTAAYIRQTGRRISLELYDHAIAYFRDHGIPMFRAVVEKSNREALLFYQSLDCERGEEVACGKSVEMVGTVEP